MVEKSIKIFGFQLNIKKLRYFFKREKKAVKKEEFFYPKEKIEYLKSLNRQDRWPPFFK